MGRVDEGIEIAERPEVIFTCFGDMMRVPGSKGNLLEVKAQGADIRMVYSPLDALRIARENPDREVVFYAIGFETTAPSTALTLQRAKKEGIENFSVFCNHVTIVPPVRALLDSPDVILADIELPDEDGYTLLRKLRGRSPADGGQIPAIAVTTFSRRIDRRRAFEAGFHMHLSKPVEADELVAAVWTVVRGGSRAEPA
jgi:CheY-like chemotaxis protein